MLLLSRFCTSWKILIVDHFARRSQLVVKREYIDPIGATGRLNMDDLGLAPHFGSGARLGGGQLGHNRKRVADASHARNISEFLCV
jgi:hypothetical protein